MIQKRETPMSSGGKSTLSDVQLDPFAQNLTFRERLRQIQERRRTQGRTMAGPKVFHIKHPELIGLLGRGYNFNKGFTVTWILLRFLMCFHAVTKTFAYFHYITPFLMSDYGPWAVYYFNVCICFTLVNRVTNWLCLILYDPSYPKTKDNPFPGRLGQQPDFFIPQAERSKQHSTTNAMEYNNGSCVLDLHTDDGLKWTYCDKCEMDRPPRAHHCNYCKKCITKRDHHCFMVGNCVGFNNQRYFIVFNFYTMISGLVGGVFTFKYISHIIWPQLDHWYDALFPIAIYKAIFGSMQVIHALLLFLFVIEIMFGSLTGSYFFQQMTVCSYGYTLYEAAKQVPVVNKLSMNRNLQSVFGNFWALNFLFPMTLILPQIDDGIYWDGIKIDHTRWKKNGSDHRK